MSHKGLLVLDNTIPGDSPLSVSGGCIDVREGRQKAGVHTSTLLYHPRARFDGPTATVNRIMKILMYISFKGSTE
jgi:hypothetical protein